MITMKQPQTRREKEVWEACDALYTELGDVNEIKGDPIFTKLLELGYKKGSPNEIYRYRKSWKEKCGFNQNEIEKIELAPTDPISRAVEMVRDEIQAEAKKAIDEMKERYEVKLQELEQSYVETKIELLAYLEKNKQLTAELVHKDVKLGELRSQNVQLLNEIKLKDVNIEQLESHYQLIVSEQDKHHQEIKSYYDGRIGYAEAQANQWQTNWQNDRAEYKVLIEDQRHKMMMELDAQRTQNNKLQESFEVLKSQYSVLESRSTQLEHQITTINQRYAQAQEEIKQLHVELVHKDYLIDKAKSNMEHLRDNKTLSDHFTLQFSELNAMVKDLNKNIQMKVLVRSWPKDKQEKA